MRGQGGDPAAPRREYAGAALDEAVVSADPFEQFAQWYAAAVAAGVHEPNAMTLATADSTGQPSARTVLLKAYDERGFVFFTNYGSRKGRELEQNPRAALVFAWLPLHRQVLISGAVERVDRAESVAYFRSRPRGAQLGAWASEQSAPLLSRRVLDERFAAAERAYPAGTEVPVPDWWGGLRVRPATVEFWQGRTDRLHDRLRYRRRESGGWLVERLFP